MTGFCVSDLSGTPQAGRTPAATPPLGGSNARETARRLGLTPEGSQPLEKCPHATTTLKGSQPEFRVSDRSGTPQGCNQPEEYSGERDPEALRGGTPPSNTPEFEGIGAYPSAPAI